jgi:hypothetical protein
MDKARDALRDLSEASEREEPAAEPTEEPAGDAGSEETSGEDRPAHD